MSKDQNTVACTHGLGLKCSTCYDQRFGANWKPKGTTTGRLPPGAGDKPNTNTPKEAA